MGQYTRNQQEIEKNRATPHHENDPESTLPNQRSQVTKMRYQNMPAHCQCVLRADVPADNRFQGTSSSKKVTQDHEVVRKIGKIANYQNEVSAIFTVRLEKLCERGAWILQMGAFFGVSLNLLRSGIRCHGKRRQSFELNKVFTVV